MSVFHNNVLSGAAGQTGGADADANITKSVRFNKEDSAYLNRTPSSAGNTQTWTWSGWVKYTLDPGDLALFTGYSASSLTMIRFKSQLLDFVVEGVTHRRTAAFFRDTAWYHIVWAFDSTQSTASNRSRLYINGVEITDFSTNNDITQNATTGVNSTNVQLIGASSTTPDDEFDGYMADVYLIDGQQLDPTSFGAFDDNGVWQAAAYSGSFGTNGFHLFDFANESGIGDDSSGNDNDWTANNLTSSSSASTTGVTTTVPQDVTGDWLGILNVTPTNTNGPVAVFPDGGGIANTKGTFYWSGLTSGDTITWYGTSTGESSRQVTGNISESTVAVPGASLGSISLTVTAASGSAKIDFNGSANCYGITPGVVSSSLFDDVFDVPTNGDASDDTGAGGELSSNYCVWNALDKNSNVVLTNGNLEASPSGGNWSNVRGTIGVSSGRWYWEIRVDSLTAQMLGVATNSDPLASWFGGAANQGAVMKEDGQVWVNQTSVTDLGSFAAGDIIGIGLDLVGNTIQFYKNGSSMGSAVSITGGRTYFPIAVLYGSSDKQTANWGQRAFAYGNAGTNRPAATFKALCTSNLDPPTIADGSDYFEARKYTGNSSTQTISGFEFSPDLVWLKSRDDTEHHGLFDTHRGALYRLVSDYTYASTSRANTVTSFNSDGFSLGSAGEYNGPSEAHIAWAWDAGTSPGVSNTDGSITSTVTANSTAGFSIVAWTGTGSAETVGHGLGAKPEFIFSHRISGTGQWPVYNSVSGATKYMYLNGVIEARTYQHFWNNTEPTSSVFSIGNDTDVSTNGGTHIAYCMSPVAGYSAVGSYSGTGTSDGAFVFTGMRPAWVMIKRITTAESWVIYDTSRNPYNGTVSRLFADLPNNENDNTGHYIDILSNGFKVRSGGGLLGASGDDYLYVAFAENPFQANGGLAR